MEDIGATSFTVAEAIVELVANSIDARVEAEPLVVMVQIDVAGDSLSVVDDGRGMSADILAEAVRLGVKMDKITKTKADRKGMFGLGMKTACASLGRYWAVYTRPEDTAEEHFVEFDLEQFRKNAGNKGFEWKVSVRSGPLDRRGPLADRKHGTAVIVKKLRDRAPMVGPVLARLGEAYKPHLDNGDQIIVNGDPASPREPQFIEGSRHEIDLYLGSDDEYHISGWVALDKKIHNDQDFGLNLYRKNQLVESWNKDWFPVHLMTSRILGDVNLDFVPTNFNKKGFQTQSVEWKLATNAMKEFLKPVVRASREMSRGRKDAGRFARAVEGLERALGKAGEVSSGGGPGDKGASFPDVVSEPAEDYIDVEAEVLVLGNEKIRLSFVVEEFQSDVTPWGYIFDDATLELQAVVNSNSRLFLKVRDEGFLGALALADSVASFLMERKTFESSKAREIRDRWLYLSLPSN
jgi:hypothetical protein